MLTGRTGYRLRRCGLRDGGHVEVLFAVRPPYGVDAAGPTSAISAPCDTLDRLPAKKGLFRRRISDYFSQA